MARLNNAMGRNAGLPLEVIDLDLQPPLPGALAHLLEQAAAQRPEVGLARQAVAAAQEGWQAARAEFLPKIFVRADVGYTDGTHVGTGFQEGGGLHLDAPLYTGGLHRGELRGADAEVEAAVADAQAILDLISLQVNLAYRGVVASRERIDLARTAVVQATENLRLLEVRYRNGDATPTDIVDSEAALTRSQAQVLGHLHLPRRPGSRGLRAGPAAGAGGRPGRSDEPTQEGLYQHFRAIAESTDLPMILYNIPGRTSSNLEPATVARLSKIANIIGIKEASGSIVQQMEVLAAVPPTFRVLSGDDAFTFPLMALGGVGIISVVSNGIPLR